MNRQLVRKVGDSPVENLINSTAPLPLTTGVTVRGGQGELPRGTVLALSSEEGDMVVLGATPESGETLTANCVLADPVDAGDDPAPAVAYRTGHFNRPALFVAEGYELTMKDEEDLRHGGILLSDALA